MGGGLVGIRDQESHTHTMYAVIDVFLFFSTSVVLVTSLMGTGLEQPC